MHIGLKPKNIIIVGGASGIGFATAEKLLESGAKSIILASRNIDKLNAAKARLKPNNLQKVYVLNFDITHISEQEKFIENAQRIIGTDNILDGLVISSGVNFDGSNWKGFNISERDWDNVMNTNLKGVFFLIRNFANFLYANQIKGNICVVSSISAHRDMLSVYQITKKILSGIVHTYGKYLAERGVILNAVEPGPVYSDMMQYLSQFTDGKTLGKPWPDNSIKRTIRAEEIAEIIYFLMTEMGEPLSGSCVLAGGGTKSIFPG